jgi:hypothetical protein
VTVSKLYIVGELSTAGELYVAGEPCGSGRAMWQWASAVAVGKLGVFGRSLAFDPVLAQMSQWPTAPTSRRNISSKATSTYMD